MSMRVGLAFDPGLMPATATMVMRPMKIHLDTDLAGDPDDVCALAMLLTWPGVEITGITTVGDIDGRRAGYVHYVLALAGRGDIPVAAGADQSGGYYASAMGFPEHDDYWPEPVEPAPGPIELAFELIEHSIQSDATIIGIGPYTNLALFDTLHPGLLAEAPVCLMGGYVNPVPPGYPQWGRDDDFNVQVDVASAYHVLQHCIPTLVPLEITVQTALRRSYLDDLRRSGPLGELIAMQGEAQARDYRNEEVHGRAHERVPDDMLNFQHDPLACAVALGWDGVTIEPMSLRLDVVGEQLHMTQDPAGDPYPVVTAVDGPRFNDFWRDIVCNS